MSQMNFIGQLFFEKGLSYAEIAKTTGFDVETVKKYIHVEDSNQPLLKPSRSEGFDLACTRRAHG